MYKKSSSINLTQHSEFPESIHNPKPLICFSCLFMTGMFKKFRPGKKLVLSSWDRRCGHFIWNIFTTQIDFGWSTNQSYKNGRSYSYKVSIHFETVLIKSSYFSCNGLQGQQYLLSFASSLSILLHGTNKEKGVNWSPDYLYAVDQNHGPTALYKHHRLALGLEDFKSKMKSQEKKTIIITILQTRSWLRKTNAALIPRLQQKICCKG